MTDIPSNIHILKYQNKFDHFENKTYYWISTYLDKLCDDETNCKYILKESKCIHNLENKIGIKLNRYFRLWDDNFMLNDFRIYGLEKCINSIHGLFYNKYYSDVFDELNMLKNEWKKYHKVGDSLKNELLSIEKNVLIVLKNKWPIFILKKQCDLLHALGKLNPNYIAPDHGQPSLRTYFGAEV